MPLEVLAPFKHPIADLKKKYLTPYPSQYSYIRYNSKEEEMELLLLYLGSRDPPIVLEI